MQCPLVSVLMPVRNAEKYLRIAIESILTQTFRDFEFIIVNDGSTDMSKAILTDYERADDRVRVYHQQPRGLIASLNRACHLARGRYLARMDADDVCLPARLGAQVEFLGTHRDIGMCGTLCSYIDSEGRCLRLRQRQPCSAPHIGWSLLFQNYIVHSAVMIRREVLSEDEPYRAKALYVEDWDLWLRLMFSTRIANCPKRLIRVRHHEGSVSAQHASAQERAIVDVQREGMSRLLGEDVPRSAVEGLRQVITWKRRLKDEQHVHQAAELIWRLYEAFNVTFSPTNQERHEIARDAANLFFRLARVHADIWTVASWAAFTRSVRLNPFMPVALPFKALGRMYDAVRDAVWA